MLRAAPQDSASGVRRVQELARAGTGSLSGGGQLKGSRSSQESCYFGLEGQVPMAW